MTGIVYTGSDGKKYTAGAAISLKNMAEGMYVIAEDSSLAARILSPEHRTQDFMDKIRVMVSDPRKADLSVQTAWPEVILYQDGRSVGYTMRNLQRYLDSESILADKEHVYPMNSRILMGQNLCAALSRLHRAGHLAGCLTPANIMVDSGTGMVMLAGAEDFQLRGPAGDRIYRCTAWDSGYTAPEILRRLSGNDTPADLSLPVYTVETDLFALGVNLFMLLMNGCHPYSCTSKDAGPGGGPVHVPLPDENIRAGVSYILEENAVFGRPVIVPDYRMLPRKIRQLFYRCFIEGSARWKRWEEILRSAGSIPDIFILLKMCHVHGAARNRGQVHIKQPPADLPRAGNSRERRLLCPARPAKKQAPAARRTGEPPGVRPDRPVKRQIRAVPEQGKRRLYGERRAGPELTAGTERKNPSKSLERRKTEKRRTGYGFRWYCFFLR